MRLHAAGEDRGAGATRDSAARRGPEQRVEPSRDRRSGIDKGDRPGREPLERAEQQGKVGAGEDDVIGPPSARSTKQGAISSRDFRVVDRLSAHRALGDGRKRRRADEGDLAIGRVIAHERVRVVARDRPRVASTLISPEREALAAGLIAGTTPTNGRPG